MSFNPLIFLELSSGSKIVLGLLSAETKSDASFPVCDAAFVGCQVLTLSRMRRKRIIWHRYVSETEKSCAARKTRCVGDIPRGVNRPEVNPAGLGGLPQDPP